MAYSLLRDGVEPLNRPVKTPRGHNSAASGPLKVRVQGQDQFGRDIYAGSVRSNLCTDLQLVGFETETVDTT